MQTVKSNSTERQQENPEPLSAPQLGCGTHWHLLPAVCRTAGAGGRKRDPRPSTAGEEDEAAKEEHAAGEGVYVFISIPAECCRQILLETGDLSLDLFDLWLLTLPEE